jgi:hypothetical protein
VAHPAVGCRPRLGRTNQAIAPAAGLSCPCSHLAPPHQFGRPEVRLPPPPDRGVTADKDQSVGLGEPAHFLRRHARHPAAPHRRMAPRRRRPPPPASGVRPRPGDRRRRPRLRQPLYPATLPQAPIERLALQLPTHLYHFTPATLSPSTAAVAPVGIVAETTLAPRPDVRNSRRHRRRRRRIHPFPPTPTPAASATPCPSTPYRKERFATVSSLSVSPAATFDPRAAARPAGASPCSASSPAGSPRSASTSASTSASRPSRAAW